MIPQTSRHPPMTLIRHTEGGDEFICQVCGCKWRVDWEEWQRTVLIEGDPLALHQAILTPEGVEMTLSVESGDPYLEPFEKYLEGRL